MWMSISGADSASLETGFVFSLNELLDDDADEGEQSIAGNGNGNAADVLLLQTPSQKIGSASSTGMDRKQCELCLSTASTS